MVDATSADETHCVSHSRASTTSTKELSCWRELTVDAAKRTRVSTVGNCSSSLMAAASGFGPM